MAFIKSVDYFIQPTYIMNYDKKYLYQRIVKAKNFIDKNYLKAIHLDKIYAEACFSKYHFIRLFKISYGISPHQYLIRKRINHAKNELRETEKPVFEIGQHVGFASPASFCHLFKKTTSLTPTEYRNNVRAKDQKRKVSPLSQVPGCYAILHEKIK